MSFYLIVRNILTPTLCSENRNIHIVHSQLDNFPDKLASAVKSKWDDWFMLGVGRWEGHWHCFYQSLANGLASSCWVSAVTAHRVSCLFRFCFLANLAISHRLRRMRSWTCVTIAALPSLSEEHWIGDTTFAALPQTLTLSGNMESKSSCWKLFYVPNSSCPCLGMNYFCNEKHIFLHTHACVTRGSISCPCSIHG